MRSRADHDKPTVDRRKKPDARHTSKLSHETFANVADTVLEQVKAERRAVGGGLPIIAQGPAASGRPISDDALGQPLEPTSAPSSDTPPVRPYRRTFVGAPHVLGIHFDVALAWLQAASATSPRTPPMSAMTRKRYPCG